MESDYPRYYHHLQGLIGRLSEVLPGELEAFRNLHKEATRDGVLDRKTKELIALGIAMTVNCDGCIAYHVKDALLAGAGREEILETVGVVVMMGGGPAVVYACQALEALDQFEREQEEEASLPAL
jgi:AhpD family alkylhydroperoxidase